MFSVGINSAIFYSMKNILTQNQKKFYRKFNKIELKISFFRFILLLNISKKVHYECFVQKHP